MNSKRHKFSIALAIASIAAVLSPMAMAAEPFMPNGVTKPNKRVELALPIQGQVKEVPVKAGDVVKQGQLLVQLDDELEKRRTEALKIDAESSVQIQAAEKELAQRTVERDRKLSGGDAFTQAEKEEAKLAVEVGGLRVELAQQDKLKKALEMKVQQTAMERMRLLSPVNGVVEKVEADVGEVVDPSKPSIVVVDNSKIDVEASLPTAAVNKLKIGDVVEVKYADETETKQAKITFLSPVADAASETRLLRAQMDNTDNKPSGMSVSVKLADQKTAAAGTN
jgi:RND family efflux transporter MFP subunit